MADATFDQISEKCQQILQKWLESCTRSGRLSRNTIAVGIVVLHHLRDKCPVKSDEVISPGGEIVGSRSRLHKIMQTYDISKPEKYLKEVTTRQAHPDGKRLFEALEYALTERIQSLITEEMLGKVLDPERCDRVKKQMRSRQKTKSDFGSSRIKS